jgi:hypothetical protein
MLSRLENDILGNTVGLGASDGALTPGRTITGRCYAGVFKLNGSELVKFTGLCRIRFLKK